MRSKKIGLTWNDWSSGERLFVNDLASPWGGSRYIIRDMRDRLFPFDKGAKGIRRKKSAPSGRDQHFKALRNELILSNELKVKIKEFNISFVNLEQYQNIVSELDEFKSQNSYVSQENKIIPQDLRIYNRKISKIDKAQRKIILKETKNMSFDDVFFAARDSAFNKKYKKAILLCDYVLEEYPGYVDAQILKGRETLFMF